MCGYKYVGQYVDVIVGQYMDSVCVGGGGVMNVSVYPGLLQDGLP